MRTHSPRPILVSSILFFLFIGNASFAQERVETFVRAGYLSVYSQTHIDINYGEAYIVDNNEFKRPGAMYYGIDIKYRVSDKWLLGVQADFSTEYEQRFYSWTNKYVVSDSFKGEAVYAYKMKPFFGSLLIERRFQFLKKLEIAPKIGIGIQFFNKQSFEKIYSNSSLGFDQLEKLNNEMHASLREATAISSIGLAIYYSPFMLDLSYRSSFSQSPFLDFGSEQMVDQQITDNNFFLIGIGLNLFQNK